MERTFSDVPSVEKFCECVAGCLRIDFHVESVLCSVFQVRWFDIQICVGSLIILSMHLALIVKEWNCCGLSSSLLPVSI